jgi:hypothetical protein
MFNMIHDFKNKQLGIETLPLHAQKLPYLTYIKLA